MLCRNPLSLPDRLDGKLQAALSFWQSLKRAENGMPFGDDLALSALSGLGGRCFVLRAFAWPERFRFEYVGEGLQGATAAGKFIDEIAPDVNFSFLRAQSSATVEAAEPTLLRLTETSGRHFSRLLLPLWGNGQIGLLLGALDA